jgi:hypothetical protein
MRDAGRSPRVDTTRGGRFRGQRVHRACGGSPWGVGLGVGLKFASIERLATEGHWRNVPTQRLAFISSVGESGQLALSGMGWPVTEGLGPNQPELDRALAWLVGEAGWIDRRLLLVRPLGRVLGALFVRDGTVRWNMEIRNERS